MVHEIARARENIAAGESAHILAEQHNLDGDRIDVLWGAPTRPVRILVSKRLRRTRLVRITPWRATDSEDLHEPDRDGSTDQNARVR